MPSLLVKLQARILPRGWLDALRQFALFAGAYYLYRIVRGAVDGRATASYEHARDIIDLERTLHTFVEPSVQAWASGKSWLIDTASWMYVNSHFTITVASLIFIYLFRNESFYFVRNMFCVAMLIALVGYLAFPTAPPRFMPEWGFSDSVAQLTGVTDSGSSANALYNPFAAIPSMHVAFSLMIGFSMIGMIRRRWAQVLWACYPLVVTFVVVATANHWWFDAFLGALTAAASAWTARALLARARPDVWAWRPLATVDGRVAA
jgi:hypothetical protein